jgi:adenylyltransferase/sulfurtransferase
MIDSEACLITAEELKKSLHRVTLLDVREVEEHAQSSIPNSKLIPLGELNARAKNELDQNSDIVIYCAHGIRSMHALIALRTLGFQKLRSLVGGIVAWEAANGPSCHIG